MWKNDYHSFIRQGWKFTLHSSWVFNQFHGEQVWRTDSYCNYPGGENKEGTQLGSDKWGTEWKYHGSKSIHSYQHQILNRNECGNYWKESVKVTQSLAEVATDKPWCVQPCEEQRASEKSGASNGNFRENICSEDDLRTRIFGTFVVKFLACLPLLGFSNI